MAEDSDVLRKIWDSHLPIAFHLAPNDLYSIKDPEPYYSMVPRLSYFSLIIDKITLYFSQFIDTTNKSTSNLWLEFPDLGVPLKFNYPIGVLYDLYASDIELPWNIQVNFDRYPENVLVRCSTRALMESSFLSSLKEADALKRRQPLVSTMQKRDHNHLWNAVLNHRFDQFWSINRQLMTPSENQRNFLHIPFRLYLASKGDLPVLIQRLIKPSLNSGQQAEFEHLIEQTLGPEAIKKYKFVTHGIELSRDIPLQWMSEHLSYLDNFLHIVVHDN